MWKSVTVMLFFGICLVESDNNRIVHVCTDTANVAAQCLVVGNANIRGGRVLVDESYEKYAIPLITRTDDLVLPRGGEVSNFVITFVQVSNPGDSGLVTMLHGGIGHRTVSLHLEAPRSYGYHFQVVIKGAPIVVSDFNSPNNTGSHFNPVVAPTASTHTPGSG